MQGDWSSSWAGSIIEFTNNNVGEGQRWNGAQDNGCLLTVTVEKETVIRAYCPTRFAGTTFQISINYQNPLVYWLREGDKCHIGETQHAKSVSAYKIM